MNICAKYSFNNGFEVLKEKYSPLLTQIEEIVRDITHFYRRMDVV